jgi:hypothetical protein
VHDRHSPGLADDVADDADANLAPARAGHRA